LLARIIGDVETLENFYVRVVSPPLTAAIVGIFTSIFLASFYPPLAPVFLTFFLSLGLAPAHPRADFEPQIAPNRPSPCVLTCTPVSWTEFKAWQISRLRSRADERLKQIAVNGLDYGNAQRRMARVTGIHAGLSTLLTNLGMWTILFLCIPQVVNGRDSLVPCWLH
jgi:ABC-type transport system involved in cytochrome bd biosynthesis fused ATPase/permease subunit